MLHDSRWLSFPIRVLQALVCVMATRGQYRIKNFQQQGRPSLRFESASCSKNKHLYGTVWAFVVLVFWLFFFFKSKSI